MDLYQSIEVTQHPQKGDYLSDVIQLYQEYSLGDQIGQGGYGFVISGIQYATNRPVAIKCIYKDKLDHDGEPSEITILKELKHPTVIEYIDHFEDSNYHYLVMELFGQEWDGAITQSTESSFDNNLPMTPPDLSPCVDFIKKGKSCDLFECIETFKRLSEQSARIIFKQLVQCISDLEDLGIYHRDIKDENIVIDSKFRVKLIDFGSAIQVNDPNMTLKNFYGTITFASPEILLGLEYEPEPAEVWSLGVLLYVLVCGQTPFQSSDETLQGTFQCTPADCSRKCSNLIGCMLQLNPKTRISIKRILKHEWFD